MRQQHLLNAANVAVAALVVALLFLVVDLACDFIWIDGTVAFTASSYVQARQLLPVVPSTCPRGYALVFPPPQVTTYQQALVSSLTGVALPNLALPVPSSSPTPSVSASATAGSANSNAVCYGCCALSPTPSPSSTVAATSTPTPTLTATASLTPPNTASSSITPTFTPSSTGSSTFTPSASATLVTASSTQTGSVSATQTASITASSTSTDTQSITATPTASITSTATSTSTVTDTSTDTDTSTNTGTPTSSLTASVIPPSLSATQVSGSNTASPSATNSLTLTGTGTEPASITTTPTPTPTPSASQSPSLSPSETQLPLNSPYPTVFNGSLASVPQAVRPALMPWSAQSLAYTCWQTAPPLPGTCATITTMRYTAGATILLLIVSTILAMVAIVSGIGLALRQWAALQVLAGDDSAAIARWGKLPVAAPGYMLVHTRRDHPQHPPCCALDTPLTLLVLCCFLSLCIAVILVIVPAGASSGIGQAQLDTPAIFGSLLTVSLAPIPSPGAGYGVAIGAMVASLVATAAVAVAHRSSRWLAVATGKAYDAPSEDAAVDVAAADSYSSVSKTSNAPTASAAKAAATGTNTSTAAAEGMRLRQQQQQQPLVKSPSPAGNIVVAPFQPRGAPSPDVDKLLEMVVQVPGQVLGQQQQQQQQSASPTRSLGASSRTGAPAMAVPLAAQAAAVSPRVQVAAPGRTASGRNSARVAPTSSRA